MNSVIDGVDYGSLAQLLGKWIGNKRLDNSSGENANPEKSFTDEINFTIAGPA